jgi:hypothetical protein
MHASLRPPNHIVGFEVVFRSQTFARPILAAPPYREIHYPIQCLLWVSCCLDRSGHPVPIACRIDSGVHACAVTYVFLATATEQIILASSAENTTWSSAAHDAQKVRSAP